MGLVNCYELKGTKHLIQSPFTTEVSIKHWITFKNYMVCESYVCLLETGLANTIWLKKKMKERKKENSLLECDCFGNSQTQPRLSSTACLPGSPR